MLPVQICGLPELPPFKEKLVVLEMAPFFNRSRFSASSCLIIAEI